MCNKIYECQELNSLVEGETWIISDNVCYLVYKSKDITQETAEKVFLSWYKQGEGYDYTKEPEDELAGKLVIIRHRIFMLYKITIILSTKQLFTKFS